MSDDRGEWRVMYRSGEVMVTKRFSELPPAGDVPEGATALGPDGVRLVRRGENWLWVIPE